MRDGERSGEKLVVRYTVGARRCAQGRAEEKEGGVKEAVWPEALLQTPTADEGGGRMRCEAAKQSTPKPALAPTGNGDTHTHGSDKGREKGGR